MGLHIFAKFGLIFIGGAAFALLALQAIPVVASKAVLTVPASISSSSSVNVVEKKRDEFQKKIETKVQKKVQETEDSQKNLVEGSVEKVLSAVTESPVLAPFFKTKQQVEQTVDSVMNLPDDQKSALCKQICTVEQ